MAVTVTPFPEVVAPARTTDATPVVVSSISFTVADKSNDTFFVEATAVQENAANPLAYFISRIVTMKWTAGVPTFVNSSDGANGVVKEHGDTNMDCTLILTGGSNPVKPQVTGVAGTNLNWFVRVTRLTLLSN